MTPMGESVTSGIDLSGRRAVITLPPRSRCEASTGESSPCQSAVRATPLLADIRKGDGAIPALPLALIVNVVAAAADEAALPRRGQDERTPFAALVRGRLQVGRDDPIADDDLPTRSSARA